MGTTPRPVTNTPASGTALLSSRSLCLALALSRRPSPTPSSVLKLPSTTSAVVSSTTPLPLCTSTRTPSAPSSSPLSPPLLPPRSSALLPLLPSLPPLLTTSSSTTPIFLSKCATTSPKGQGLGRHDPADRSKVTEAAKKYFSHDGTKTKIHGALCPKPSTGVFKSNPEGTASVGDYKAGIHYIDNNRDTDHWSTANQMARDAAQTK